MTPRIAQSVRVNLRARERGVELRAVLREVLGRIELARERRINLRAHVRAVVNHRCPDVEIIRLRIAGRLETLVGATALDYDDILCSHRVEAQPISLPPRIAQAVQVDRFACEFIFQRCNVADKRAGARVEACGGAVDRFAVEAEIGAREPRGDEIICGVELSVCARAPDLKHIVRAFD